MSLPKIANLPSKEITLPVSKKKIKIRPFLVKEEKVLLMIKEDSSTKVDDFINAMKDIVSACTYEGINVEDVNPVDLEYTFFHIRMLAKGTKSELQFRCQVKDEDGEICGGQIPVEINLEKEVQIREDDRHQKEFPIPGTNIYIVMKYPNIETTKSFMVQEQLEENYENIEKMLLNHVDYILDGEEAHTDFTYEELQTWFEESVPGSIIEEIVDKFFKRMPKLHIPLDLECPKCGNKEHVEVEGIENFFPSS